ETGGEVAVRLRGGRVVARVEPGQHVQQHGGVGDGGGEGADLIERGGVGDEAVTRDPAVGRLHADDAAAGGGLADGSAGVGTQGDRNRARRHGHRRAAGGSARRDRR